MPYPQVECLILFAVSFKNFFPSRIEKAGFTIGSVMTEDVLLQVYDQGTYMQNFQRWKGNIDVFCICVFSSSTQTNTKISPPNLYSYIPGVSTQLQYVW